MRLVDEACARPLVWLTSPPGAGKTTLIEQALERQRRRAVWLELEPSDDAATLLQQLALALEHRPEPQAALALDPAEGSARTHLLRALATLGPGGALVLDNYERLSARSSAHALLAAACERLPPGVNLIVSSRAEPPSAYARARVHGHVALLDWQALRLTDEESAAIVARRLGHALPPALVARLHTRAGGWAAGLVLLCEAARARDTLAAIDAGDPVLGDVADDAEAQVVFDYFAGEVFDEADPVLRDVLLDTAFVPRFSAATAARLSGRTDAHALLRAFADRGYFTQRRDDTYQYHLLFRDFLRQRARKERGPRAVEAMQRTAAELLVEAGDPGAAIELLAAIGDHDAVARLVHEHAPLQLDRGHVQSVAEWLTRLPDARVEADPWLLTWRAAASLHSDERLSQRDFARAHEMFMARGDAVGAYRTWVGAVESQVYRWRHGAPLDPWLDRLAELEARFPAVHDPALEARIASAAFLAIFWRRPWHARLGLWLARARAAFARTAAPTPRLLLAATLVFFMLMHVGDLPGALAFIDGVGVDPLDPDLAPLPRLMWGFVVASARTFTGDAEGALTIAREALASIDRHGLELMRDYHDSAIIYAHLGRGDYAAARAHLALLRVDPGSVTELCHLHYQHAWTALGEGDFLRAAEHCRLGLARAAESDDAWPAWGLGTVMAQVQIESGEIERGLATLSALEHHPFSANPMHRLHRRAIEAWLALRRGEEDDAAHRLTALLAELGALGLVLPPLWGWRRPILRELLLFALERDLAPGFVRRMLAASGLDAETPPPSLERWPWPVRVRTLGGLALEVEGQDVAEAKKAPTRPLELLQALVAMGADRVRVPETRLMEALWPDSDGAVTLRTALHRLRRLIGQESVTVVGGTLALDPRRVWIDLRALEARLASGARGEHAVRAVLALYRGRFLPDADGFWAIAPRERLHAAFSRWVQTLGSTWLAQGRTLDALELYLAALASDDANETFTHGLMLAHLELGQRAEAIAAFQRCEAALRRTVGVSPSAELRALLTRASDGERGGEAPHAARSAQAGAATSR